MIPPFKEAVILAAPAVQKIQIKVKKIAWLPTLTAAEPPEAEWRNKAT